MDKAKQRFENAIFLLLIFLSLAYVWWYPYFLTGDGPAHVYNSKILLDLLRGANVDFYKTYYDVNLQALPNWFSHVLLVVLQFFFSPFTADKLLISLYVIMFPVCFRWAILQASGGYNSALLLIFVFVFQWVLYYGFYNFCFGIVGAFLFIAAMFRLRTEPTVYQLVYLLPLSFLIFFTHLFGWFFLCVVLAGIFTVEAQSDLSFSPFKNSARKLFDNWWWVAVCALPPLALSAIFVQHNQAETPYFPQEPERLQEAFLNLEMLVLWGGKTEFVIAKLMVVALIVIATASIGYRIVQKKSVYSADGLLFAAICFGVIYFQQPRELFLGGNWMGRMGWLSPLLVLAWVSCLRWPPILNKIVAVVAVCLFAVLMYVRIPYQRQTSQLASEYFSAITKIPPGSTVLPLNFSDLEKDVNNRPVRDWRSVFIHAFDYSGAVKPLIILSNYEAATKWFPLKWKNDGNPFTLLGNIEGRPPDVNLKGFENNPRNIKIDFVVVWKMKPDEMFRQKLNLSYNQIFVSAAGNVEVWKRKI